MQRRRKRCHRKNENRQKYATGEGMDVKLLSTRTISSAKDSCFGAQYGLIESNPTYNCFFRWTTRPPPSNDQKGLHGTLRNMYVLFYNIRMMRYKWMLLADKNQLL